jgi:GAF domain-containing protein/HAMP domain-containing protein
VFKAIRDFLTIKIPKRDPREGHKTKAEAASESAHSLPLAHNARNIALIGAVVSAFTASFYLYLGQQTGTPQIYVASLNVWMLAALLLISFLLIQRQRIQTGVWLMLVSACLSFAVSPLILSGWGLIQGMGLAVLVILVASQTLSGLQAERAIFLGAVFTALTILADLFDPIARPPAPQTMTIGLSVAVVVAALIFGITFIQQFQQFRVAARLTALILIIALPVIAAIAITVTSRAEALMDQQASDNLLRHNEEVKDTLVTWMDLHNRALTELAILPDITSMDPVKQRPLLQAMAKAYPNLYLIHITNLNGIDIARSDDVAPKDYHDRQWFLGAESGAPLTLQVLVGRTNGAPALSLSTPIRDASGQIIGVAAIHSTLDIITTEVDTATVGQTGYVFIVDDQNNVVAHPDPALTTGDTLHSLGNYPPVAALRQGRTGIVTFTDEKGERWRAYTVILDNGWGIVAQEPEAELLAPQRLFERISGVAGLAGLAVLLIVAWLAIHRTLRPIEKLTETVQAITTGDLTRTAAVTSQDEIGTLAQAFNSMTTQLRDLISTLEQRVADRSKELEQRAIQLRTAAEVGSAVATQRDLTQLLNQTTRLISERFGFYHVGIFLLDERREYAVLRASNSLGGKRMLERGHRLKIGETGIVGYVTGSGDARIALDVGKDAVFFDNPDLPETRSEMALPLKAGGRTLGALDIQSTVEAAFTPEDIATLQILADQMAIAIENAELFAANQAALEAARRAYGEIASHAWRQRLETTDAELGFRSMDRGGTIQVRKDSWSAESSLAITEEKPILTEDSKTLCVPILIRGQAIGVLRLLKPDNSRWTEVEVQTIQALSDQFGGALEAARLYDEAQRRAEHERIISEITSKISSSINIRNVLQTAVEELGRALPGSEVIVQFQGKGETGEQR